MVVGKNITWKKGKMEALSYQYYNIKAVLKNTKWKEGKRTELFWGKTKIYKKMGVGKNIKSQGTLYTHVCRGSMAGVQEVAWNPRGSALTLLNRDSGVLCRLKKKRDRIEEDLDLEPSKDSSS